MPDNGRSEMSYLTVIGMNTSTKRLTVHCVYLTACLATLNLIGCYQQQLLTLCCYAANTLTKYSDLEYSKYAAA